MPDYLGEHQRKVKQDEKDDDTIQGLSGTKITLKIHHRELYVYYLFSLSVALDEGDIQILKTYVSPQ